ncbi:MAG TPA: HEAT repeat domain-containing protein [Planctomycetota bacterium]
MLLQLRNAWRTADRQHVLDAAWPHADRYIEPLRELFDRPEHSLVIPGLELAGYLKLRDLLPDMLRLATRPELRVAALSAADLVEPLPEGQLLELLTDDDREMLVAALAMASRREDPPLHAMIDLLAHESSRVATEALASLPARLPEDCRLALDLLTANARPEVATRAWQALLRLAPVDSDPDAPSGEEANTVRVLDPGTHATLLAQLGAIDDETRLAALEKLSAHGEPEGSEQVTMLLEGNNSDAIKKQACVFLGRVQHREAVRPLIDVLRDSTDAGLRANAHWSLQRITGQKLHQDPELWNTWWTQAGQSSATPGQR